MSQRVLAIIPARGGSKGIPRKNIRLFNGKPLIEWTIEAALASKLIDEVIISTDCEEIAKIGQKYHLPFPGLRSEKLANDSASTVDAVAFSWRQAESRLRKTWDFVIILQPTSPLRSSSSIDLALEKLLSSNATSLASFCKAKSNPLWMVKKKNEGFQPFLPTEWVPVRRQDLPDLYEYNGAIYIASQDLLASGRIEDDRTLLFEMDEYESIDIDDEVDFIVAEFLMNKKKNEN